MVLITTFAHSEVHFIHTCSADLCAFGFSVRWCIGITRDWSWNALLVKSRTRWRRSPWVRWLFPSMRLSMLPPARNTSSLQHPDGSGSTRLRNPANLFIRIYSVRCIGGHLASPQAFIVFIDVRQRWGDRQVSRGYPIFRLTSPSYTSFWWYHPSHYYLRVDGHWDGRFTLSHINYD